MGILKPPVAEKNTLDMRCRGEDYIHYIDMNEEIKELMTAINVAASLIDPDLVPGGMAFVNKHYPINRKSYHWSKDELSLSLVRGENLDLRYPTFLWSKRHSKDQSYVTRILMECEIDHKLIYPVRVAVVRKTAFSIAGHKIRSELLENDEQFIAYLKKELERL